MQAISATAIATSNVRVQKREYRSDSRSCDGVIPGGSRGCEPPATGTSVRPKRSATQLFLSTSEARGERSTTCCLRPEKLRRLMWRGISAGVGLRTKGTRGRARGHGEREKHGSDSCRPRSWLFSRLRLGAVGSADTLPSTIVERYVRRNSVWGAGCKTVPEELAGEQRGEGGLCKSMKVGVGQSTLPCMEKARRQNSWVQLDVVGCSSQHQGIYALSSRPFPAITVGRMRSSDSHRLYAAFLLVCRMIWVSF